MNYFRYLRNGQLNDKYDVKQFSQNKSSLTSHKNHILLILFFCNRTTKLSTMSVSKGTDAIRMLRGMQMVLEEVIKANEHNCRKTMKNCNIATALKDFTIQLADRIGAAKLKVII